LGVGFGSDRKTARWLRSLSLNLAGQGRAFREAIGQHSGLRSAASLRRTVEALEAIAS